MRARVGLTNREKEAINAAGEKQLKRGLKRLTKNFAAIMLYNLHTTEGWGKKKLINHYKRFAPFVKELLDYYDMHGAEDTEFICNHKLKELGINLDEMDDILDIQIVYK